MDSQGRKGQNLKVHIYTRDHRNKGICNSLETGKQMGKREPKWLQGRKPIRDKQIHSTEPLKISRIENTRPSKSRGK